MNQFSKRVALSLFAIGMAGLALPFACASGQTIQFQRGRCDWNLNRRAFDNYIGDGHAGGFTLPRYQHHLIGAGLSTAASIGVRKVLHFSPRVSAATAVVGVGFIPHIRQVVRGSYTINTPDWIADGWIRSAPAWYVIGHEGHDKRSHIMSAVTYLAGYAAVACWASP